MFKSTPSAQRPTRATSTIVLYNNSCVSVGHLAFACTSHYLGHERKLPDKEVARPNLEGEVEQGGAHAQSMAVMLDHS